MSDDIEETHFGRMCYLASLGFNVLNGAIIQGNGAPPISYEFEPGVGVHCTQSQDGKKYHRFIRFSDLYAPSKPNLAVSAKD